MPKGSQDCPPPHVGGYGLGDFSDTFIDLFEVAMIHPDVMTTRFDTNVVPAIGVIIAAGILNPKIAKLQVANDDVLFRGRPFANSKGAAMNRCAVLRVNRFIGINQ